MKLVLFLTYGSSLSHWMRDGILEREMALYLDHIDNDFSVDIVSYGGQEDKKIAERFEGVRVLCNEHNLHLRLYSYLIPFLHRSTLSLADIFKTNQMFGSHVALMCGKVWRKPLLLRQGYGYFEHRQEEFGIGSSGAKAALSYERRNLTRASASVFTTKELAERAVERHGLNRSNVHIIPNYIVPSAWEPGWRKINNGEMFQFCFFGRFTAQKNLDVFLEATASFPVAVTLIGDGPEKGKLEGIVEKLSLNVKFIERQSQRDLTKWLNDSDAFVLPSLYEGHPKALLEMMAFGIPVLVADSPGIREHVERDSTGVVCNPSLAGMKEGIYQMINMSSEARSRLARNAHLQIMNTLSVQKIAQNERDLMFKICKELA